MKNHKKLLRTGQIFATLLSLAILGLISLPTITLADTLSIASLTPNYQVTAGTAISFQVTSFSYAYNLFTISDSLPGSSISNSTLNTRGRFNWKPSQMDIGTHVLTIVAADASGDKNSITQTLIVLPPSALSIQNISPEGGSLFPSNAVTFSVGTQGYVSPTFSLSDSFAGSSISNSNITAGGNVSWTPTSNDVGPHNILITVRGSNGRSDTVYQSFTVNGIALQNISDTHATVGSRFTFTIAPYGMNNPSYRVGDSAVNNSIDSSAFSGNSFSWTPLAQDAGTHILTINATDASGNSSRTRMTVMVVPVVSSASDASLVVSSAPAPSTTPAKLTTSRHTFTTDMKEGSTGKEVAELQKKLKAGGFYTGPMTSSYGAITKAAVIRFQKAKHISAAGVVGIATREALNKK